MGYQPKRNSSRNKLLLWITCPMRSNSFRNLKYKLFYNSLNSYLAVMSLKSALVIYWSNTGNTEKVAYAIRDGLEHAGLKVDFKKPTQQIRAVFGFYALNGGKYTLIKLRR